MDFNELAFGVVLVLVVAGVAIYFGYRQRQTLAQLNQDLPFSPFEREFLRAQVRRRMLCCILLGMFALVLIGWLFMAGGFDQLQNVALEDEAVKESLKKSVWFYTGYVIFALVLLMVIVALAAVDFLATARYGLAHKRKLLRDHQAVLALEAAQLRLKRDVD